MDSRVSLTARVIVYYCLPAVGAFSKVVSCVCIYGFMGLIWSFANGFKCANCSTQVLRNAKKVSVAWKSILGLRQRTAIKFFSRSNLYQQAASH